MGNWLQLAGGLVGLFAATPALFRHPYSRFAGLRYAVGLTMFVAVVGMTVFLLRSDWLAFFVLSASCALLGWLGAGLLVRRMHEQAAMTSRQRRRARRKAAPFGVTAAVFVGGLLSTVGVAISLIEGP